MSDVDPDDNLAASAVVFVHGFISDASAWSRLDRLLGADPELASVPRYFFQYRTAINEVNPTRNMPNFDALGEELNGFLTYNTTANPRSSRFILVGHSQGGLIIQHLLYQMLVEGETKLGLSLRSINSIVLLACPNRGSGKALGARRFLLGKRNAQEVQLRPLDDRISKVHRVVVDRLALSDHDSAENKAGRIPFHVFWGSADGWVRRESAQGSFPYATVVPGDHESIIRPEADDSVVYRALKQIILATELKQIEGDEPTMRVKLEDLPLAPQESRLPEPKMRDWEVGTSAFGVVEIELLLQTEMPRLSRGQGALVHASGLDLGYVEILDGRSITFGRDAEQVAVALDRMTISGVHGRFTKTVSGGWRIEDLGSLNGTIVNGSRVTTPELLQDGDVIQLGEAWFVFTTTSVMTEITSRVSENILRSWSD